jgi:hypothetical protein
MLGVATMSAAEPTPDYPMECEWPRHPVLAYEPFKARAKSFGLSLKDVIALSRGNDPYAAGVPYRRRNAEWFAKVCATLAIPSGWHVRRIHYLLVSRPDVVPWPDGRLYVNTVLDWKSLLHSARDAVALSLVPPDILSDARNDSPRLWGDGASTSPEPAISAGWAAYQPRHDVPRLEVAGTLAIARPIQVELWAEKTTMNDVLLPLAQRYGLNVVTASGEISAIACRQLVDRAARQDRPHRILYISDFDPAGLSMPVAAARKIEFEIDRRGLELDIQVRAVVLTEEQCRQYALPRTPIKESDRRGARFEQQYGDGATELDALEALHPGELRRILAHEIRRYWNPEHDGETAEAKAAFEDELDAINDEVHAEFAGEIAALDAEEERLRGPCRALQERARELFARIEARLAEQEPSFEPPIIEFAANEDPDPLFDSRRSYLDQLARYKRFQNKTESCRPAFSRAE